MSFPLLYQVGVHTYSPGVPDAYNIAAPTFVPTLDQPGTPTTVIGWAVPQSTEPKVAGHDRVIVEVELMALPGTAINAYDRIDLPDGQYEVLGAPEDYTHGPFVGGPSGLVINLRKVLG